jgi:hypothetical protein
MGWSLTNTDLVNVISRKDKETKNILIDILEINKLLLSDITDEAKREVRDTLNEKIENYKSKNK